MTRAFKLAYLVAGGAIGTVARYLLSRLVHEKAGPHFPYGTLAVNALGCLIIGILASMGQGKAQATPEVRFIFMVGFCGAFTTFSTLILETDHLFKSGQMLHAYGNILISLLSGFAAFALGGWIGENLKFIETKLPGVFLIEPRVLQDERGFFMEDYRKDLFEKNGIHVDFVQDNHSLSRKGALRGLHYQVAPKEQAKLVRVVRGEVFDVVVDLRPGSKTFGQYTSEMLSAGNKMMLFVPPGFAHGYLTLSDEAEFLYKVSDFYSPEHERCLRWDDTQVDILWPKLNVPYILSRKDKIAPGLKELK